MLGPRRTNSALAAVQARAAAARTAAAGPRPAYGTLGHHFIALSLAIYSLGYIAPAKLLYSKGAITIFCYIATRYIAIL